MSSLSSKLARLTAPVATSPGANGPSAPSSTGRPLTLGPSLVDRVHGPGFRQGRVEVGAARAAEASTVASLALDEAFRGVDTTRMLLVDTETTGLNGGTGTLPFVIGLAWFEGESLVVRQLFVPRPGQERPLLMRLGERLAQASLMVTFNGKCFDWPLLRARFVMNRIALPPPPPHLDLLHCARRIFKRRLGATRLQDLEAQVLGFHRHDDISGAEIPAVYFDFLRTGRVQAIEKVLEHNALDLISMAAVLAELCRRFDAPDGSDAAEDCLGLARVCERSSQPERAVLFARAAVERAEEPATALEACSLLAKLAVRRRAWAEAAQWLERATQQRAPEVATAHLAYARICEHGLKDYGRALHHAKLAWRAEDGAAHAKRLARLERKQSMPPSPSRERAGVRGREGEDETPPVTTPEKTRSTTTARSAEASAPGEGALKPPASEFSARPTPR
ncbi:MAG: ribonuclease H-like domain-containing protein [Archangiaceae bacterium]|nr:ribonuclease H-like domain-containing protein [Archangiaceae bacterium]